MKYTLYFYLEETFPGGSDGKTTYIKLGTFLSWKSMLKFAKSFAKSKL